MTGVTHFLAANHQTMNMNVMTVSCVPNGANVRVEHAKRVFSRSVMMVKTAQKIFVSRALDVLFPR